MAKVKFYTNIIIVSTIFITLPPLSKQESQMTLNPHRLYQFYQTPTYQHYYQMPQAITLPMTWNHPSRDQQYLQARQNRPFPFSGLSGLIQPRNYRELFNMARDARDEVNRVKDTIADVEKTVEQAQKSLDEINEDNKLLKIRQANLRIERGVLRATMMSEKTEEVTKLAEENLLVSSQASEETASILNEAKDIVEQVENPSTQWLRDDILKTATFALQKANEAKRFAQETKESEENAELAFKLAKKYAESATQAANDAGLVTTSEDLPEELKLKVQEAFDAAKTANELAKRAEIAFLQIRAHSNSAQRDAGRVETSVIRANRIINSKKFA